MFSNQPKELMLLIEVDLKAPGNIKRPLDFIIPSLPFPKDSFIAHQQEEKETNDSLFRRTASELKGLL
ncbi:MAG: hypothetical protein AAF985_16900 [Bacteroidota bacterium]